MSCLLDTEGPINWYDTVNAVNYQTWFTWSYHFILLSLVELLHSHDKSCHDSSGGQKLPSTMTGKATLLPPCPYAGIFPPVPWLKGISVVSLNRLEMTTETGLKSLILLMTIGDFLGWQMTDLSSSTHRVLPPHASLKTEVSTTIVHVHVLNNHNQL